MNKESAIKATRNGAIAAAISGVVSLAFVAIAIGSNSDGKLALWNDPLNFIDVLIIFFCAYGIYKKSRTASILMFVYFVISKAIIALETQSATGIGTGLIFLYFFGRAIQGSFAYHRLEKEENADYKPSPKWAYMLVTPIIVIVLGLAGIGLASTAGIIPSTKVLSKDELRDREIVTLRDEGVLGNDDEVLFFFSEGFLSVMEGGSILTEDRVLTYLTDENDELKIYEVPLNLVTDVLFEGKDEIMGYSVFRVTTEDPDLWVRVVLSDEQKGDQMFVEAIFERISR